MAVTLTEAALEAATGMPAADAARLLPVAGALVTQYAAAAPDAIANEATIRTAAWLFNRTDASIKTARAGEVSASFNTWIRDALRGSGAMALLSRWRPRQARIVEAG